MDNNGAFLDQEFDLKNSYKIYCWDRLEGQLEKI
jgi:hypothetical protein